MRDDILFRSMSTHAFVSGSHEGLLASSRSVKAIVGSDVNRPSLASVYCYKEANCVVC